MHTSLRVIYLDDDIRNTKLESSELENSKSSAADLEMLQNERLKFLHSPLRVSQMGSTGAGQFGRNGQKLHENYKISIFGSKSTFEIGVGAHGKCRHKCQRKLLKHYFASAKFCWRKMNIQFYFYFVSLFKKTY